MTQLEPPRGMFNFYEQQPASPPVEWFRYANRRSKDIQRVPKRLTEQAASTLAIFLLTWVVVGATQALDKLVYLIIAALASLLAVPAAKWLFHFLSAFHALSKEEIARLTDDNAALTASVNDLRAQLDLCLKAASTSLKVEIPPEQLKIQGHPPTVVVVEPFTDAVRQEGAKRLADLRERAIHQLANRKVTNDNELAVLERDIEEWEREVLAALEQYGGVDEITTFRVLGTYAVRVTGGLNAEHNRELGMLWERLKRLENVIARLSR